MRTPSLAAICLLSLLPLGCVSGDGMQTKLQDATTNYNKYLRWGDIDRAAEFLPATSRDAFMENYEHVHGKLVLVDYQVTRLQLEKQIGVAHSRAEISWHTDDHLVVKTTWIDQTWQWHEGQFVLVDEQRSSGEPLAVFAEPGETHPYLPGLQVYRETHEIGLDDGEKRKRKRKRARKTPGPEVASAQRSSQ